MKVAIGTVDFNDYSRRAIWWDTNGVLGGFCKHPNTCPKATREDCANFVYWRGLLELDNVIYAFQKTIEAYENGKDDE